MCRFEDKRWGFPFIEQSFVFLSRLSPKDDRQRPAVVFKNVLDGIGRENLPAMPSMGISFSFRHRQDGVQEKHPLFYLSFQVVAGQFCTHIIQQLFLDVP